MICSKLPTPPIQNSLENIITCQSIVRRWLIIKKISISRLNNNFIKTTIVGGCKIGAQGSKINELCSRIRLGAIYTRITILGGRNCVNVIGINDNELPKQPGLHLNSMSDTVAVMTGGFFVHKKGLMMSSGTLLDDSIGMPIGKTNHRNEYLPIPKDYRSLYGSLEKKGEVLLQCAPVLIYEGQSIKVPENDLFRYRVTVNNQKKTNPNNNLAGGLTHSSDFNERAAISLSDLNVSMHTLTTGGDRSLGVSMSTWKEIISFTAKSKNNSSNTCALNLDGGESVFLSIHENGDLKTISKGGASEDNLRSVANIIICKPSAEDLSQNHNCTSITFI